MQNTITDHPNVNRCFTVIEIYAMEQCLSEDCILRAIAEADFEYVTDLLMFSDKYRIGPDLSQADRLRELLWDWIEDETVGYEYGPTSCRHCGGFFITRTFSSGAVVTCPQCFC